MTLTSHSLDLQATAPSIALALDEVGVTGVVRGIVLGAWDAPTTATFDIAASVGADARGAHLSRFHEALDQALALVADDGRDVPSLAVLAAVIATRAADLQGAATARAHVRATIAWPRVSPASGRRTVDPFVTWATVLVDRSSGEPRTTTTIGVEATGMTACPCAQNLVRDAARTRLLDDGMDEATIERALDAIPIATHNQRSTGRFEVELVGDGAVTEMVDPLVLVDLVRESMSANVHELLKRDDERAIVEAAHADPRFVEDCVRALLVDALDHPQVGGALPAAARLLATQVNHESIHAHDVVATRSGSLRDLRDELGIDTPPAPA
ncbi:MAG: cyclohydrolase FolE2 [Thermoleophilia bacterium]|nr:cyclohydrolase FolE2 [Thermoleophilia bacterium]